MALLFISRTFPPATGGLEKHNHALLEALRLQTNVEAIVNTKGKAALPWFLPLTALKALFCYRTYRSVLLGDGLLTIIGWLLKLSHPDRRVCCVVHGLDITYSNAFYQFLWVKHFMPKMDLIIAVSQATADTLIQKGISPSKVVVIPNGVDFLTQQPCKNRKKLDTLLGINTQNKFILISVGRLVKRKGFNWFIRNVMPKLSKQCIYIIAGTGPEQSTIVESIKKLNLEGAVYCIGFVDEGTKSLLLANSNLFIQPNIKIEGDMEGFGIAVLEANTYGLPVLGSNLEGLRDSITENQNGWLVEPENAKAYADKIIGILERPSLARNMGENAKSFCYANFSWQNIANRYISTLNING